MDWMNFILGGPESYLAQGGLIMVLLVLASVIGLAIILEKLFRLRGSRVFDDHDAQAFLEAIQQREEDRVHTVKTQAPEPMADMVDAAEVAQELPKDDLLAELSTVASTHVRRLGRRLRLLGILASVAPLLGLLGTVLGMIQAMDEVALGAAADPMVVGQGISQALITTAVGLAVGIPLLFMHSLLKDRVNRYASRLEEFGHDLMKAMLYPESLKVREPDEEREEDVRLHSLDEGPAVAGQAE